jgi:hypothetical protein
VIFQRQLHVEKKLHSKTVQKYNQLYQQHNIVLQDLEQEKNLSEIQKKLISELEGIIEVYQANYLPVQRPSENGFNSGAADATLPAIRSKESIRQEPCIAEGLADSDANHTISKKVMSILLPVSDSNNYRLNYMTNSPSSQNTVLFMQALPINILGPGIPRPPAPNRKGATMTLPQIEELASKDYARFEFIIDSDFNHFPISSIREAPSVAGIGEQKGLNPRD